MQRATRDSFNSLVLGAGTVVVEFSSPWCAPCRALEIALDQAATQRPGLRVLQVDVAAEPALGQAHGVRSIPTLVAFHDGEPVAVEVGYRGPAHLGRFLDRLAERHPSGSPS